jgi:PRC-barrel domain
MHTPLSSTLRYLDAENVDDTVMDFDNTAVRAADGQKVGEVDGFIIDPERRRAYYVVVDSGGWFTSRHYLVPIGHTRVDTANEVLVLDIDKDAIGRYPEFDPDRFAALNDDELRSFESQTVLACCPEETAATDAWGYERWAHYRQPEWWRADVAGLQSRTRPVARSAFARTHTDRERPVAVGTSGAEGDSSPHLDGRAQPGDILGIETAGETTSLGETGDEENDRRRKSGA